MAVQNAERQCGHGEEVHRRDGSTMIAQKDQPPPSRIRILGRTLDQRDTVRSETSKPSLSNSPWMRGAPHVGFSATMRKISSRTSRLKGFLPAACRVRDSQDQYKRKPVRCQRTTVSGVTSRSGFFHPDHSFRRASASTACDDLSLSLFSLACNWSERTMLSLKAYTSCLMSESKAASPVCGQLVLFPIRLGCNWSEALCCP